MVSMDFYDWFFLIVLIIVSILCLTGCVSANRKIAGNPESKTARNIGIAGDAAMTLVCPPAGLIAIGYDMYHSRNGKNAPPKVVAQPPVAQSQTMVQQPTTTIAVEQPMIQPRPVQEREDVREIIPNPTPSPQVQVTTIPIHFQPQGGSQDGSVVITITTTTKTIKK